MTLRRRPSPQFNPADRGVWVNRTLRQVRAVTGRGEEIARQAYFDAEHEQAIVNDLWLALDRIDPLPSTIPPAVMLRLVR